MTEEERRPLMDLDNTLSAQETLAHSDMDAENEHAPCGGGDDKTGSSATAGGLEEHARAIVYCLTLDNPYDPMYNPTFPSETNWTGSPPDADSGDPGTFLDDECFLKVEVDPRGGVADKARRLLNGSPTTGLEEGPEVAPNRFQKIIELLLRLKARGVQFEPRGILRQQLPTDDHGHCFHGFALEPTQLYESPDRDEIYIKLICCRDNLTAFAQRQGLRFASHPYSYAGGSALQYTKAREKSLSKSVKHYLDRFPESNRFRNMRKEECTHPDGTPFGFRIDEPQQMRLLSRVFREGYAYGGCGIPFLELKRKEILVREFFPLHNEVALKALGIKQWASFRTMFSTKCLKRMNAPFVLYFGERVALYFVWLREYAVVLGPLGLVGLACGLVSDGFGIERDVVKGFFGLFVVCWAVYWNCHWARRESAFASRFAQGIEVQQKAPRDEYKPDRVVEVGIDHVLETRFDIPFTIRKTITGRLREPQSSHRRRIAIRVFVTYPVTIFLTALMLMATGAVTWWRFEHQDTLWVRYVSSLAAVAISAVFGKVFEVGVEKLNALENNRTDDEEEAQYIYKSFFFYFFSSYFACFALEFWPSSLQAKDISNEQRLSEMTAQMLTITVFLPMLQNAQELILPVLFGSFRRRKDKLRGTCAAIRSMLCCKRVPATVRKTYREQQLHRLWMEGSRDPYDSPAGDYLEITLQFGFMAMFAAAFSWGPFAAFLYNLLELRVDLLKILEYSQRPPAAAASSIGPWNVLFWLLTFFSVLNNAYLISFLSEATTKIGLTKSGEADWATFTVVQYFLAFCGVLVFIICGRQPTAVAKAEAKETLLSDRAVYLQLMKQVDDAVGSPIAPPPPADGVDHSPFHAQNEKERDPPKAKPALRRR